MRKSAFFYCLVFCFVTTSFLFAEGTKRTAVIEDSAGVTTEVSDLRFLRGDERFGIYYMDHPFYDKECLGINTKAFDVLILTDSLISIEVKGGTATVLYQLRGIKKTLTGKLVHSYLDGKSDFGDMSLSIDKLKKLTFKEPAITNPQEGAISYTAKLVLTDGSRVPVANLRRYDKYFSTAGYVSGGSISHGQYADFRFLRGESLSIIDFKKIKRITFQSGKNVKVTLKNGKEATGILSTQKRAEVEGFTGIYEEGAFFIPPNHVKEIVFVKTKIE